MSNSQRIQLNAGFEDLNLQLQEVKTLLQAVINQHGEIYLLGDQLSGIARLLGYIQDKSEAIQSQADDVCAWAEVTYRRSQEVAP